MGFWVHTQGLYNTKGEDNFILPVFLNFSLPWELIRGNVDDFIAGFGGFESTIYTIYIVCIQSFVYFLVHTVIWFLFMF